jgi:hypothetical protein
MLNFLKSVLGFLLITLVAGCGTGEKMEPCSLQCKDGCQCKCSDGICSCTCGPHCGDEKCVSDVLSPLKHVRF